MIFYCYVIAGELRYMKERLSINESMAATFAERYPHVIFFIAELSTDGI